MDTAQLESGTLNFGLPSLTNLEQSDTKTEKMSTSDKVHYALLASFVALNVADAITTAGFLALPGTIELSPMMRQMIHTFGQDFALWSKVLLASSVTPLAFESAKKASEFVGLKDMTKITNVPLALLNAFALGLVINNAILIDKVSNHG